MSAAACCLVTIGVSLLARNFRVNEYGKFRDKESSVLNFESFDDDCVNIQKMLELHGVKGFLPAHEASALYKAAKAQSREGPILEVGSFCGRSAIYLGHAAKQLDQKVFSIDHHLGSEEHQKGEAYFDGSHWDADASRVDTLPEFRRTLRLCDMENTVIAIVASSQGLAPYWNTPLALIFIDGGHSEQQALADCMLWAKHLMPNGILAIHDIFENPEDGGQAPYNAMLAVMASYELVIVGRVDSLVFLSRVVC